MTLFQPISTRQQARKRLKQGTRNNSGLRNARNLGNVIQVRRNDRGKIDRKTATIRRSRRRREGHIGFRDIPVITIGVPQFGANRLPMSTTLRGWLDFPPVLQDGGTRGGVCPSGRRCACPACVSLTLLDPSCRTRGGSQREPARELRRAHLCKLAFACGAMGREVSLPALKAWITLSTGLPTPRLPLPLQLRISPEFRGCQRVEGVSDGQASPYCAFAQVRAAREIWTPSGIGRSLRDERAHSSPRAAGFMPLWHPSRGPGLWPLAGALGGFPAVAPTVHRCQPRTRPTGAMVDVQHRRGNGTPRMRPWPLGCLFELVPNPPPREPQVRHRRWGFRFVAMNSDGDSISPGCAN